jgi:hypothetical protein
MHVTSLSYSSLALATHQRPSEMRNLVGRAVSGPWRGQMLPPLVAGSSPWDPHASTFKQQDGTLYSRLTFILTTMAKIRVLTCFIGTTPGLRATNLGDSSWVATSDLIGASNYGDSSAASDPVDDPANSGDTSSVAVSDSAGTWYNT